MRRWTRNIRLISIAVIAGAWEANAGPNTPTLEELLLEQPPAYFAPTFSESITPSIDIKELRLAWTDRGKSFVELTYPAQTEGAFLTAFPDAMTEINISITAARKRWILSHVSEKLGDERWLYSVDDGALHSATITDISCTYDGLSGKVSFFGQLDLPIRTHGRHLYISFPCESKPRLENRDTKEFPKADFEALRNWMKSKADEPGLVMVTPKWFNPEINYKTVELLDARTVPQSGFNLITVRHALSDYLLFLAPLFDQSGQKKPEWKCVTMEPVADRPGEFCGATDNATIYALPDFNQDGSRELMVNSSYTTTLYDLSIKDRETPHVLRCQLGLPTSKRSD